jgi:hypothetical protein
MAVDFSRVNEELCICACLCCFRKRAVLLRLHREMRWVLTRGYQAVGYLHNPQAVVICKGMSSRLPTQASEHRPKPCLQVWPEPYIYTHGVFTELCHVDHQIYGHLRRTCTVLANLTCLAWAKRLCVFFAHVCPLPMYAKRLCVLCPCVQNACVFFAHVCSLPMCAKRLCVFFAHVCKTPVFFAHVCSLPMCAKRLCVLCPYTL